MRVLILAYDFPPLISTAANRPYSWYKYFAENNVFVTVITRDWPSDSGESSADFLAKMTGPETGSQKYRRIIRAGYIPNIRDKLLSKYGKNKTVLLRKLLSYIYLYLEFLFFFFDGKSPIYYEADKLLRIEKFDFIIATGNPFLLFKYSSLLSAKHKIPWVADYRDGWTTNQGGIKNSFFDKTLNAFYKILEKVYVRNALFVTTAAPPYKDRIEKILPDKRVEVIYNGYFEEYFTGTFQKDAVNSKFTIAYAGTIYAFQKIFTFLEGARKMLAQYPDADLEIIFYGLNDDFRTKIEEFDKNVLRYIVFENKIPVTRVSAKLRDANLLLLLSGPKVDALASKVFDYLAAKRKIVLVENDLGILRDILLECKAGESLSNSDEVCDFMIQEYTAYLNRDRKNIEVQSINPAFYSRRSQAEIFLALLNGYLK